MTYVILNVIKSLILTSNISVNYVNILKLNKIMVNYKIIVITVIIIITIIIIIIIILNSNP